MRTRKRNLLIILMLITATCYSNPIVIKMYKTAKKGRGDYIGTITAINTPKGLLLKPALHGLPSGWHGFHVHQTPSCLNFGLAAGGHFDPYHTGKHLGPYRDGHLGDLPRLCVNSKGQAIKSVIAPRLKQSNLKGHAIIIHMGGDNYSDKPKKLGGGGARIACGVVSQQK